MRAFIGTVPFTILEAIHFVVSQKVEDADIYIVDCFEDSKKVADRLRNEKIFQNVYFVDNVLLTYPITIRKCMNIIHNRSSIKKIMNKKAYDEIYYNNSGWLINSIFYSYAYKNNKRITNHFIEHSFYSYTQKYDNKNRWIKYLIKLFGMKCLDESKIDYMYFYHPELIQVKINSQIIQLEAIDKNQNFIELVNRVFHYDSLANEFADKKIIIFEQGKQSYELDTSNFWNHVISKLGKKNIIIKPHPRQKNSSLQNLGCEICKNYSIPWEVILLNNQMDKKILISVLSSASITPKLLFNEEPTSILLYKLIENYQEIYNKDLSNFLEIVKDSYTSKNKVYIPESFEELKEILNKEGE